MYKRKKKLNPADKIKYLVASDVIEFTEQVLTAYGRKRPSHEGMVYWAGRKEDDRITVCMAIAPATISKPGMVRVSHYSNLNVVLSLSQHRYVHVGQVHSHPTDWVDHSPLDDTDAAFKIKGLLSIVVPNYGSDGMRELHTCGVHRYKQNTFIRLNEKYIGEHFQIVQANNSILIDQRNGKQ